MEDCIFCKIAKHEMPKDFTYEDDTVMVFPDIHPVKPTHLLVVPKKHIPTYAQLDDNALHAHIRHIIQEMVKKTDLEGKGYRIMINGGGAQAIDHLHFHLTGPWGFAAGL